MLLAVILIIAAYLLGSVNCAIIICKVMGLPSPRTVGSGNPGATNVLRLGNKKAAALTMIGDAVKGMPVIFMGHYYHASPFILTSIALAAVLGHIFPIFFGFKGGKGVATLLGVMIALNLWLGLCFIATWLVIALISRYSSLASIIATLLSPVYAYHFMGHDSVNPLIIMAVIVIIRHKANIKRLLNRTESKIGQKAKA